MNSQSVIVKLIQGSSNLLGNFRMNQKKNVLLHLTWAVLVLNVMILPTVSYASDSHTLFRRAAGSGDLSTVRGLLAKGAKIDYQHKFGTALMRASEGRHVKVIQFLLDKGAKIDLQDNSGNTALMIASWRGHTRVVRFLLSKGARTDLRHKNGETALMIASRMRHKNVEVWLIQGVKTDLQAKNGATASADPSKKVFTPAAKTSGTVPNPHKIKWESKMQKKKSECIKGGHKWNSKNNACDRVYNVRVPGATSKIQKNEAANVSAPKRASIKSKRFKVKDCLDVTKQCLVYKGVWAEGEFKKRDKVFEVHVENRCNFKINVETCIQGKSLYKNDRCHFTSNYSKGRKITPTKRYATGIYNIAATKGYCEGKRPSVVLGHPVLGIENVPLKPGVPLTTLKSLDGNAK